MLEPTSENVASSLDPSLDFDDTMEWLLTKTNFPTFAEFSKNPDKWRANKDELFECIDSLNVNFKDRVHEVKYYWRGKYYCKSLARIYDCAKNEGLHGLELEMEPIVTPMDGTSNLHTSRVKVRVNVWPKDEFRSRGGIVANDK